LSILEDLAGKFEGFLPAPAGGSARSMPF